MTLKKLFSLVALNVTKMNWNDLDITEVVKATEKANIVD